MTTAQQINSIATITESLVKTGHDHQITVDEPREWDELQGGVYITGYKTAALDRCAFVTEAGEIKWHRCPPTISARPRPATSETLCGQRNSGSSATA